MKLLYNSTFPKPAFQFLFVKVSDLLFTDLTSIPTEKISLFWLMDLQVKEAKEPVGFSKHD